MKLCEIKNILNATVLCGDEFLEQEVHAVCGSDLMSDVLAFVKNQSVLLTGLINPQVIRTAEMMDMCCVIILRGKTPDELLVKLAKDKDIVLMVTNHNMYSACGKLYSRGLYQDEDENKDDDTTNRIHLHYDIDGDDFMAAGEASSDVKRALKQLNFDSDTMHRATICMYEGEINMMIHANGGSADVYIEESSIEIVLADTGPGIEDIEQAMREGYSTATQKIRELGFGAGMGLPNIKRYSDKMDISSQVGKGTTLTIRIDIRGE